MENLCRNIVPIAPDSLIPIQSEGKVWCAYRSDFNLCTCFSTIDILNIIEFESIGASFLEIKVKGSLIGLELKHVFGYFYTIRDVEMLEEVDFC